MRSNKNPGFTLIELLVTTALVAVVSIAILAVFAGGINVYNRLRALSDTRKDILFSLEKIEKDLRSACNIPEIAFKGESAKITFPALVKTAGDEEAFPAPGSISYYIDNSSHYLVSEENDYSAATAAEPPRGLVTQLVYVSGLKFSYYYYDPKQDAYLWSDRWVKAPDEEKKGVAASKLGTAGEPAKKDKPKVNTPLGVKINLQYEDRGQKFDIERTILFPLAASLRVSEALMKKNDSKKAANGEKKG